MQFKHFYAFTALALVCLLASCRSAIDFDNLDPTTEVETGITLPVGSIHMTVGDIMGEGLVDAESGFKSSLSTIYNSSSVSKEETKKEE